MTKLFSLFKSFLKPFPRPGERSATVARMMTERVPQTYDEIWNDQLRQI